MGNFANTVLVGVSCDFDLDVARDRKPMSVVE